MFGKRAILSLLVAALGPSTPGFFIKCRGGSAQRTPSLLVAASSTSSQGCCKVCRKGRACGNSCIAKDKICRKPSGCACDADSKSDGSHSEAEAHGATEKASTQPGGQSWTDRFSAAAKNVNAGGLAKQMVDELLGSQKEL